MTDCPKCEQMERVLDEIEDYLENRQDVRDGSYGEPQPNTEMSLLTDLRWWRHQPSGQRSERTLRELPEWEKVNFCTVQGCDVAALDQPKSAGRSVCWRHDPGR